MFKPGVYKIKKVLQMGENGKYYVDAEQFLAEIKEKDPDEYRHQAKSLSMGAIIREDGSMLSTMDIPEGISDEELQAAIKAEGLKIENGKIILEETKTKVEDGELYMYDKSTFLTGSEWVKISTDVEGELNMIMYIYGIVE